MPYSPSSSILDYRGEVSSSPDKMGQPVMYIVRHGEVDLDVQSKFRGLVNQGLNAKGKKDAKEIVELFADKNISVIYCDDLKRTYETALPLAQEKNVLIIKDPDLRSWDVGSDLEKKDIEKNEDVIADLREHPDKVPVGGQSWDDYEEQTQGALSRYMSKALCADEPIVIVWHGSAIQIVWPMLGQEVDKTKYDTIPLEPAGVAAVYLTRYGMNLKVIEGEGDNLDE